MDYIGVLGYYPLTNRNNPTVEELKSAWVERGWLVLLENLSKKYQKPIIISEIGYLSSDGINTDPPYHQKFAQAPLDLQEQADCYQAAFEVLWGKPWLKGIFWWQWFANPVWWPGGPTSKTEEINGKPAEEVLRKFYLSQPSTPASTPTPTPVPTTPPSLPPLDAFMKGMAFSDWAWDIMPRPPKYGPLYYSPQADASLKSLAATGASWISLLVNGTQESFRSTKITRDEYITASDEALRHVIDLAHSLGMRVILHPALFSLPNTPGISWIEIGTGFTSETQWQEWFASYREFINHYATFAQEAEVDLLYVGSELSNTTHREKDWRQVIKEVRERFKGPISYDSVFWGFPLPEYKRIKWWDAVDYIAVDCWHSLTNKNYPSVAELKEGLIRTGYVTDLENFSRQFNKPVIISEIGYDSLDGTAKDYFGTHSSGGPPDLQEQADCYQAVLEVLWGKPWLKGIFWWQWSAISTPTQWLETPQGKPAEEVLKKYYLSQ